MLLKGATHNLTVRTRSEIALYLLNHKRAHLRALEERFRIVIMVNADATVEGQVSFVIEKGEQVHSLEQAKALALQPATAVPAPVDDEDDEDDFEAEEASESEESVAAAPEADEESEGEADQAQDQGADGGQGRKRRRRRRGRRGGEGREVAHAERDNATFAPEHDADFAPQPGENDLSHSGEGHEAGNGAGGPETPGESGGEAERRRRRRGRRGGRRNRRGREGEGVAAEGGNGEQPAFEHAAGDADDGVAAEPDAPAMHVPVAEPHHDHDLGPQIDLPSQSASAPEVPPEPAHTPAPQIAVSAAPETAPAERSRRRSTVREPATPILREPVLREEGPASEPPAASPTPTAEPVVSSTAESESPRRSGWWSKRVLGRS
jgi:ribonuclease E